MAQALDSTAQRSMDDHHGTEDVEIEFDLEAGASLAPQVEARAANVEAQEQGIPHAGGDAMNDTIQADYREDVGNFLGDDEITFDDGDDGLSGGANLNDDASGPQADDHANPQQTGAAGTSSNGMAFDFDGDNSAADVKQAGADAEILGDDEEDHESIAEELGFGDVEDLKPDEKGVEASYESSSGDDGTDNAQSTNNNQQSTSAQSDYSTAHEDWPSVLIHYRGVDYDLFARDEDASSDTYFLSDVDLMSSSLGHFLSCLRDVLSEDLADSEKLLLKIDSLGLEFGETTREDFLQYNFRTIYSLHQGLMENDQRPSSDPLYAQLVTQYDCIARLNELTEGVKRGLGLSSFLSSNDIVVADYGDVIAPANGDEEADDDDDDDDEDEDEEVKDVDDGSASNSVDSSEDDRDGAEYDAGANMSGALPSDQNVHDEEEADETMDEPAVDEDEEEDEVAEDDLEDDLNSTSIPDQPVQEEITSNEGYELNSFAEDTLIEVQPSVGAFVDNSKAAEPISPDEQQDAGDDFINFEEAGEFVDYGEGGPAIETTKDGLSVNGNITFSSVQAVPSIAMVLQYGKADAIGFADDRVQELFDGNFPKAIPGVASAPKAALESQRGTDCWKDDDLIDYSDEENGLTANCTMAQVQEPATSVTASIKASLALSKLPDETKRASTATVVADGELPLNFSSTYARALGSEVHIITQSTESTASFPGVCFNTGAHSSHEGDADFQQDGFLTLAHNADGDAHSSREAQNINLDGEVGSTTAHQSTKMTSQPTTATSTIPGDEQPIDATAVTDFVDDNGALAKQNPLDEIDWEDHVVDDPDSAADTTASTIPAKRGRTEGELKGLVDETDAKRRRT